MESTYRDELTTIEILSNPKDDSRSDILVHMEKSGNHPIALEDVLSLSFICKRSHGSILQDLNNQT